MTAKIITVADIARSLKKKPRDVRRALRKQAVKNGTDGFRWGFTAAQAKKVVTQLKAKASA